MWNREKDETKNKYYRVCKREVNTFLVTKKKKKNWIYPTTYIYAIFFFRIILMFIYTSCLHVIITFYYQRQKFFFLHVLYFNARLFRASFLRVQQLFDIELPTMAVLWNIYSYVHTSRYTYSMYIYAFPIYRFHAIRPSRFLHKWFKPFYPVSFRDVK